MARPVGFGVKRHENRSKARRSAGQPGETSIDTPVSSISTTARGSDLDPLAAIIAPFDGVEYPLSSQAVLEVGLERSVPRDCLEKRCVLVDEGVFPAEVQVVIDGDTPTVSR